jgi:hypothetical protein
MPTSTLPFARELSAPLYVVARAASI